MQTIPAGVAITDYQCVDFDTGVLPAAWTLTKVADGTAEISTAQASSTPNSFYSTGFLTDSESSGTLSWSHIGAANVVSVAVAADVFRPPSQGDPGPWTGYADLACAAVGSARACLYFQGTAGFGVAFWNGMNRVDCGTIGDLSIKKGVWTRVELKITGQGAITLLTDGSSATACDNGGAAFPASVNGSATIGVARTGMTTGADMYFDNVAAAIQR